jgi:hypothetical protein
VDSAPLKGLAGPVAVTPAKGIAKGLVKPVPAVGGDVGDDGDTVAQDASMADIDSEPATSLARPSPEDAAPVKRITDPTEIVKPLPVPVDPVKVALMAQLAESTQPTRVASSKKKRWVMGLGGLAVLGAVLAYIIGTSGGDATETTASTAPTPGVTAKANVPEPTPEEAPRQPRTWANSEKPPAEEAGSAAAAAAIEVTPDAAEPAVIEPAVDEPAVDEPAVAEPAVAEPAVTPDAAEPAPVVDVEPEPETKVATPKATTPKATTPKATKPVKKPVKKTAAKPVVKKKKPAPKPAVKKPTPPPAKPGWDPNSLFPKK